MSNIVNNPSEEKFRKIRVSNKIFQEKVAGMEGAIEFLEAAGFVKKSLTINEEPEEFFVMSAEKAAEIDSLEVFHKCLSIST